MLTHALLDGLTRACTGDSLSRRPSGQGLVSRTPSIGGGASKFMQAVFKWTSLSSTKGGTAALHGGTDSPRPSGTGRVHPEGSHRGASGSQWDGVELGAAGPSNTAGNTEGGHLDLGSYLRKHSNSGALSRVSTKRRASANPLIGLAEVLAQVGKCDCVKH
jgi:hypothetical protein